MTYPNENLRRLLETEIARPQHPHHRLIPDERLHLQEATIGRRSGVAPNRL